ncbi:PIN domain-containing protein, partial [Psychrobacter sp. T6-1]|uniref:PIN domain-containing protein n=1 Tax=Psychrobacter sp. T6-1 TaxID=3457447 RepID=UPI003FD41CA0
MKHILIDYENIQPKSFNDIETNECHVWLFLGVNQQKSLPLDLVETLLRFDNRNVHIIRMQHAGKNALDFYLSFYLGKISEIDSQADVCILARDSGYDVLVDHLNSVYDGMNIMRSTNANQLSLTYDFDENIESDIEEIQIVSQNILCDSGSNVVVENENALVQSLEERIPKVVIHDCYVLVFDSMLNREVFLPSYKSNLLSAIKKYALAKALVKFDDAEQDYIVEKVFDKFIKSGLIKLNGKSEKLSYKVDSQGILDLVTEQVLLSRAKTIAGLKNVVKQKLTSYRQENDEQQVNLVITWLKNQEFIKQNNETICYPTLEDKKTPSNKVSNDDSDISKPSATVYQRAITAIKSRPLKSRPSKKSSLINYLKSHLRNEDPRVVDNLIKQMISNK